MKSICPLIVDILPLYCDGALSEESCNVVEKHLASCEDCRSHLDALKKEKSTDNPPAPKKGDGIPRFAKRISRTRRMIVSFVLAVLIFLSASFFSFVKFDTPNFISAGVGLLRIWLTDTQVAEIQKSPRVWLVNAEHAPYLIAKEALAHAGYREIEGEQMGSMLVFEKDGIKHRIHFSANRFFAIISWQH